MMLLPPSDREGLSVREVEEADGLRIAIVTGFTVLHGHRVGRHAVVGDVLGRQVTALHGGEVQRHVTVTVVGVLDVTRIRDLDEVEDVVDAVLVVITASVLHGLAVGDVARSRELGSHLVEDRDVLAGGHRILVAAVVRGHAGPRPRERVAALGVAVTTVTGVDVLTVLVGQHVGHIAVAVVVRRDGGDAGGGIAAVRGTVAIEVERDRIEGLDRLARVDVVLDRDQLVHARGGAVAAVIGDREVERTREDVAAVELVVVAAAGVLRALSL